MRRQLIRSTLSSLALAAGFVLSPRAAVGQDFLFKQPYTGITVRAGPMLFTAGGDLFEEMRTHLMLDKSDFRAVSAGVDLIAMPTSRIDVVGSVAYARMEKPSEYREWTEWDGQREIPVEQTTRLRVIPISVSLRYQLIARGHRVSSLAYIPSRTNPYVGGGIGMTIYRLEQEGDFVDTTVDPPPIFSDLFETSGSRTIAHALAGVDHWVGRYVGINAEARYTVGSARPGLSYNGYDKLDLGGLQATLGLSFRW
jgi:hypothetical protein